MNKKIGILTQPLMNNYGGILQAYALTQVLFKMGYNVEIIDRKIDANKDSYPKYIIKFLIKKYILKRKNPDYLRCQEKISSNTLKFIEQNIPISKQKYYSSNIDEINKQNYDVIIVGSDQVWRPLYSPAIRNYFLDFCAKNQNIRKVAYSASFGVSNWEFTQQDTKVCAKLAKNFDAISVREDSAVKLCHDYLGVEAVHTLDPTLLLEQECYIDLVRKYDEPNSMGTLMHYVLDKGEEKQKIIKYVSQNMNLSPFTVMPNKSLEDIYSENDHSEFEFPPLTKWLKGFMDAEYIVTDSFHGCVFSIIFNKPFIAIGNKGRGLARFNSLLNMFGLEDRLIFSVSELNTQSINAIIDWDRVNSIRKNYQIGSINFLKGVLK